MKTINKYFAISTVYSLYICQENMYDMYEIVKRGHKYHHLSGAANMAAAKEAGYEVQVLEEEDVRAYGLWRGSFMRNKGPRGVV